MIINLVLVDLSPKRWSAKTLRFPISASYKSYWWSFPSTVHIWLFVVEYLSNKFLWLISKKDVNWLVNHRTVLWMLRTEKSKRSRLEFNSFFQQGSKDSYCKWKVLKQYQKKFSFILMEMAACCRRAGCRITWTTPCPSSRSRRRKAWCSSTSDTSHMWARRFEPHRPLHWRNPT